MRKKGARSKGNKNSKMAQKIMAAVTPTNNEVLHIMSTIENDEQKNKIWQQLKTKLHSTMVAFGSGSVQLPKLMDTFRNDWGSELTSFAIQLGFGCNDASVYKMLLTMPDEIESGFMPSTGTFAFKVIPKAETSENLTKIDQSNEYQIEMRKMFARRRSSLTNANGFHRPYHFSHSFHAPPPVRPPPPPPPVRPPPPPPPVRPPPPPLPPYMHFPRGGACPRFPGGGLFIQLPKHSDGLRHVSLTNGFHPPCYFANTFHVQSSARPPPSPFAMSSPNPKPPRLSAPSPSMLQKQIEQILRSSRGRKSSIGQGHPPIVRKQSNRSQAQVEQKADLCTQQHQAPPTVEDKWAVTVEQLIEHFKQLKLSD